MCVGGIPHADPGHPEKVVSAALEFHEFVKQTNTEKLKKNKPPWEMRIGIHTGEIIAGVVGMKKFAYDIWGDTVNTASRMESSGEPGKINISERTFSLISNKFVCEHRGKIISKNKDCIDMYFVTGIRTT